MEQSVLHCAHRSARDRCDRGDVKIDYVEEDSHLSLTSWQTHQQRLQTGRQRFRFGGVMSFWTGASSDQPSNCSFFRRTTAIAASSPIERDSGRPGQLVVEPLAALVDLPQPHQSLLRCVFRDGGVAGHARDDSNELVMQACDPCGELEDLGIVALHDPFTHKARFEV